MPMTVGLPADVFLILNVIQTRRVIKNNRSKISSATPPLNEARNDFQAGMAISAFKKSPKRQTK